MSSSPFTIALTSLKPHAGRSTTALALSWALGRSGHKVLLVDGNPYPKLLPSKSKNGSALWKNVVLGSRKANEAEEVGATVVIVDAPPLSNKFALDVLRQADAILLTVFPIVQNGRFISAAKEKLSEFDPRQVLGWFVSNFGHDNKLHLELTSDLRVQLASWRELQTIPADTGIPRWDPLDGSEFPPGDARTAYVGLAGQIEEQFPSPVSTADAEPVATPPPVALEAALPRVQAQEAKDGASPDVGFGDNGVQEPNASSERALHGTPADPKASAGGSAGALLGGGVSGASGASLERSVGDRPLGDQPVSERSENVAFAAPARTEAAQPSAAPTDHVHLEDVEPETPPVASVPEPVPLTVDVPEPLRDRVLDWSLPDWRVLGNLPPRISLALVPEEGAIDRAPGIETLRGPLPASTVRALLRFGLVYTIGSDPAPESGSVRSRLIPRQPARMPAAGDAETEEPLQRACRVLLAGGDVQSAIEDLEGSFQVDARFLAGVLRLLRNEPDLAVRHFTAATMGAHRLGCDFAQLGLGLVVDVELAHGIVAHFGANRRGARLALAVANLIRGDEAGVLVELERLAALEPDDAVVRALCAERLLERGTHEDHLAVHRSIAQPAFGSPIQDVLALYQAQALSRLGLHHAAYEALVSALDDDEERTPVLRHALLLERALVAEALDDDDLVRHDLEVLYAEAPEYADVARRLGL